MTVKEKKNQFKKMHENNQAMECSKRIQVL